jgi:uncharacterized protein YdeI (YjbR/CyaY-like superfamily)
MKPRFFATPAAFRRWLEDHHGEPAGLWVGFHKVHTGTPSITWPQSVDAALSFGWIDGLRKSLGEDGYMIRFTPRRADSIWSTVNTKRAAQLKKLGLMAPAGLAALALRDPKRSAVYSFEKPAAAWDAASEKAFRAARKAWAFYQAQPPGYRRVAAHWVMSAKRPETRARRLAQLISDSAQSCRLSLFTK